MTSSTTFTAQSLPRTALRSGSGPPLAAVLLRPCAVLRKSKRTQGSQMDCRAVLPRRRPSAGAPRTQRTTRRKQASSTFRRLRQRRSLTCLSSRETQNSYLCSEMSLSRTTRTIRASLLLDHPLTPASSNISHLSIRRRCNMCLKVVAITSRSALP